MPYGELPPIIPKRCLRCCAGLREVYPLNRIAIDTIILIGPPAKDAVPSLIAALASDR